MALQPFQRRLVEGAGEEVVTDQIAMHQHGAAGFERRQERLVQPREERRLGPSVVRGLRRRPIVSGGSRVRLYGALFERSVAVG